METPVAPVVDVERAARRRRPLRRLVWAVIAVVAVVVMFGVVLLWNAARRSSETVRVLSDGSRLELRQVLLTATNFNYGHSTYGGFWQRIAPVLPEAILAKLPKTSGGSFGFGLAGATNLIVITHHHLPGAIAPYRLRISDGTNRYDACWGAHTLGLGSETVNGWQARAFPRRSEKLTLEFLGKERSGRWVELATFTLDNPAFGTFPQWAPEPLPLTKTAGDLEVTLARFRSGLPVEESDPATVARATELRLDFPEKEASNWRLQKVIISDATGNRWFPYLDLAKSNWLNWASGGQAQFLGALWAGEEAWKLDVEVSRAGGFSAEELYAVELPLSAPGRVATLTNSWAHGGVTLQLRALASPQVDHEGSEKWTGIYWGDEPEKVYSLLTELLPRRGQNRLSLVSAMDQTGGPVELVEHRSADEEVQAFFLKPNGDATMLRLQFALSESRFVEFVARPERVERREMERLR